MTRLARRTRSECVALRPSRMQPWCRVPHAARRTDQVCHTRRLLFCVDASPHCMNVSMIHFTRTPRLPRHTTTSACTVWAVAEFVHGSIHWTSTAASTGPGGGPGVVGRLWDHVVSPFADNPWPILYLGFVITGMYVACYNTL